MLVMFKGAGDLATAAARRLHLMGFRVVMTELPQPLCIRRKVAFAECVYNSTVEVEEVRATRAPSLREARETLAKGMVAVIVDPAGSMTRRLQPSVVIDARMLRRPTDTKLDEAAVVIGLGPGFTAGENVHAAVETSRGHHLGRAIYQGTTTPSTGVPAPVCGHTLERVLRAPLTGEFKAFREIGDHVEVGETVASVRGRPVTARVSGVIRGLLHSDIHIDSGIKVGDVDPRDVRDYCFTISDKANAVAGGVVEACTRLLRERCGLQPGAQTS